MIVKLAKKAALAILSATLFYFLVVCLVELFYYQINTSVSKDFNRTWYIYARYLLPYFVLAANILIAFVDKRMLNRIGLLALYLFFVGWYWMPYIFTTWPYRAIPVITLITSCYIFNIFVVERIKKRIMSNNNHVLQQQEYSITK